MEEDQVARLERMKKAQQALQGENDRMMDMMAKTTKGKEVAKNPGSQEGKTC